MGHSQARYRLPQPRYFLHSVLRGAQNFQHRPELDQLAAWWREKKGGICCLVGLGGSGKTAIASRFLYLLPKVIEETPDLLKDPSLEAPEALFLFSFLDTPNPSLFFSILAAWLENRRPEEAPAGSFYRTLQLLEKSPPLLFVLDNLEVVQTLGDGERVPGQIVDAHLRDLFDRIANGYLRGIRALVTSRIAPSDLEESGAPFYTQVDVDSLPLEAGVELLRSRGVRGGSEQLERIAQDECGGHALTIDLVGSYIAEFGGGDPDTDLQLFSPGSREDAAREPDPRRRQIQQQKSKLVALTERYRETLAQHDSVALALLERICLFRLPIPGELIARVIAAGAKDCGETQLCRLDLAAVETKLRYLAQMRLLDPEATGRVYGYAAKSEQSTLYSIHPAIRTGFLQRMSSEVARRYHETIASELRNILDSRPSDTLPSDPNLLDLLTEIIYHTVRAGRSQEAWKLHVEMVGGYSNLGRRLGAYGHGERLCRAFETHSILSKATAGEGLTEDAYLLWLYDRGRYLLGLGRLDEAAAMLAKHNQQRADQGNWLYAALGDLYVAEIQLLRGLLSDSLRHSDEAVALVERTAAAGLWRDAHAYRAQAHALRGEVEPAFEGFAIGIPAHPMGLDFRLPYEKQALLFARTGDLDAALRILETKNDYLREHPGSEDRSAYPCNLALAEIRRRHGELAAASRLIEPTYDWAVANDAQETLCCAALLRARCLLSEADDALGKGAEPQETATVLASIEEGLRIARECGYGTYHIDLLSCRAQARLLRGEPWLAERDARAALYGRSDWVRGVQIDEIEPVAETAPVSQRGIFPPPKSGWPSLLGAAHPGCGYAWGEAEGRRLLAEAILLRAAQEASSTAADPALVAQARREIEASLAISRRIRDAAAGRTAGLLDQLQSGRLTRYPLAPLAGAESPGSAANRVFISFSHRDKRWLKTLKNFLAYFIRQQKLALWDDSSIRTGALWKKEIQRAIDWADIAILLVTTNYLESEFIINDELPAILEAARRNEVQIVWIPVGACPVEKTAIFQFQAIHPPDTPLEKLRGPKRKEAFMSIVQKLHDLVTGGGRPVSR